MNLWLSKLQLWMAGSWVVSDLTFACIMRSLWEKKTLKASANGLKGQRWAAVDVILVYFFWRIVTFRHFLQYELRQNAMLGISLLRCPGPGSLGSDTTPHLSRTHLSNRCYVNGYVWEMLSAVHALLFSFEVFYRLGEACSFVWNMVIN